MPALLRWVYKSETKAKDRIWRPVLKRWEEREKNENAWPKRLRQNPARGASQEQGRKSFNDDSCCWDQIRHNVIKQIFSKGLLSTHCVPGFVLATWNIVVIKSEWFHMELTGFIPRSLLILAKSSLMEVSLIELLEMNGRQGIKVT